MSQKKPVKNTRFGRGRYNTDYAPDEAGEFHYVGTYYSVQLEPGPLRALRIRLAALWLLALAAFLVGGTGNGITAHTLYALLPFICCMMPIFYMILGLASWTMRKEQKLTRKGMDETLNRMEHSAIGLLICAGLALLGGVIACIAHKTLAGEWSFLVSCAALITAAVFALRMLRNIPVKEQHRGDPQ